MSGIAAIIRFDGGTVEPGAIENVTAAMDYRGLDDICHWTTGPVAFGHCMFRTTTESLEEVQPLVNEDESLVLVMDGWLSNWEELRSELQTRGARLRTRSDAELVLRAYEVWGEACSRHIDGEFAFVIWDARRQEAYCARDHAGLRPLHYHWDGRRLVVASDIAGVLAGPGVEPVPNKGMMAEIMANEWYTRDETIWEGLMRLVPAHWMWFGRDGARSGKYWEPPYEATIRYKRDEEYVEHYRELFADCVRRTSRTHLPLACDVSGGLDSSAVFAMAHDLLRSGLLPAPEIKGYTFLFEEKGSAADEIEYARAVARHVGAEVREVAPFLPNLSWFEARGRVDRDAAPYPNLAMTMSIGNALVGDGSRVSLTGLGGDEWLGGGDGPLYYSEQLAAGHWREFCQSFREDAADIGFFTSAWWVIRYGLAQFLPSPIRTFAREILSFREPKNIDNAFWLSPLLREHLVQRRTVAVRHALRSNPDLAYRAKHNTLNYAFSWITRDHFARQCARVGYEARFPMCTRRFIEFAFATPARIKLHAKTSKYTHIKALAGLIPDEVASRRTKAEFSLIKARHAEGFEQLLFGVYPHSRTGNIDPEGVRRLYECYGGLSHKSSVTWELWGVFLCENQFREELGISNV